jgi:hypothetical protein
MQRGTCPAENHELGIVSGHQKLEELFQEGGGIFPDGGVVVGGGVWEEKILRVLRRSMDLAPTPSRLKPGGAYEGDVLEPIDYRSVR